MDSKKFLIGTLVGGISFFLLGYLIYGMALSGFFMNHSIAPAGAMKAMSEFVWWALIVGNLAGGALLTWVLLKIGGVLSFGNAFGTGAAIGFFMALSMNLIRYATGNSVDLTATLADVGVATLLNGIVAGIIGAVLGMGARKS
jgi:hypothetical protein